MSTDFPYDAYRGGRLWNTLQKALDDLVDNKDLSLTTHRDYVVGYLVMLITNMDTPSSEDE